LSTLPVVVVTQLGSFLTFGLYGAVWRYTSVRDLAVLVRAVAAGWVVSMLALAFLFRLERLSRSALVMDGILLVVLIGSTRLLFRWFQSVLVRVERNSLSGGKRCLIYGAGDAGEQLARQMISDPSLGYQPVGFVDDDRGKHGRRIHGLLVLGAVDRLGEWLDERADCVVVSTRKLEPDARTRLEEICLARGTAPLVVRVVIQKSTGIAYD
jgi:FlaA1/EpsC-like NDP-sugar epimerase